MSFSKMAVTDLLDAFATSEPVPGGGSAVALSGALGVSVLLMLAGMPKTRTGTPEEAADLAEAAARLRPLRDTFIGLIDRDSAAYQAVIAAYRLPKGTDAEKAARRTAIEAAMRGATETPLETMRVAQQALRGAVIVARNGARSASSDAGVAVELLLATVRGAGLNVATNLPSLKDEAYVARASTERLQLEIDSTADVERARAELR